MIYEYKIKSNKDFDVVRWLLLQPFKYPDYSMALTSPRHITLWFESEQLKQSIEEKWSERIVHKSERE